MGHACDLDSFINLHKDQLVLSGVPSLFWRTIYEKLFKQIFDIGTVVKLIKFEDEQSESSLHWGLQAIEQITKSDPKNVFLIDHAWTFRLETAKQTLLENESLRVRLSNILNIDCNSPSEVELVESIFRDIWPLCNTYTIASTLEDEDRIPIWYIMDEIGSALLHEDNPNCRIVPFYFSNEQTAYSLLFPIHDINKEEFLYRDFAEGIEGIKRTVALLPWVSNNIEGVRMIPSNPDPNYYLTGHIRESLPILDNFREKNRKKSDRLKVFSQYSMVREYLTNDTFELADYKDEADILWLTEHFKNFSELSEEPWKFVNQFPFEYVITIKDLLALTCRNIDANYSESFWPKWLPITYNLKTELENFVVYYNFRKSEGLDNFWIIKPFNLARGMDTHITDNLNCIIKLATTTPKIVQKYITNPVLFHRFECGGKVKFDIRYVILLKCVKPLELFVYKKFFLRFANVPFELNNFHIYEKHFTVMNYNENAELKHMLCEEFVSRWAEQYEQHDWKEVEQSIFMMLKEILMKAVSREPPCGIAESPQSRALYAADIMLEWNEKHEMQPKILEINWTPDCKRACEYYPHFFNDIFELFFLDRTNENIVKL